MKEVRTKRLTLRPLNLADYPKWRAAFANRLPSQSKWDFGPKPADQITRTKFKIIVNRRRRQAKADDSYRFGIFENGSGQLVGEIAFDVFARATHQFANFGYYIHNQHWGHRYGREAAAAGLRIGFKYLKLNRLEAAINLDNKTSVAMVRAIGMRREGVKKRYWFEYGKWVDHLIYVANPEDIGLKARRPF